MGAFNQLNGAIFDAGAIEARLSAVDGKSIYNQRDGAILDFDYLARRLTALDGKIAVGQGGTEFDVDAFMRRLAAIEAAGVGWSPLSLFAAGEQGAWYDPSDFSSMFQDAAGTTPVTTTGQPVGKILDKSGNGNHAIQATTPNRPILQQDGAGHNYLSFNGTNMLMASGTTVANFTSISTVSTAQKLGVSTGSGCLVAVASGTGSQAVYVQTSSTAYTMDANSGLLGGVVDTANHVLLANFRGDASSFLELDKSTLVTGTAGNLSPGSGAQILLGRFGTIPFLNGALYQVFAINRSLTTGEKANLWTFMGAKEGLSL